MRDGDHAEDKGDGEQGVQGAVEHVPEGQVEAADLVELVDLVADEAQGENVQQALDNIQVGVGVDGVDGARVQAQVDEREDDLHPVLVPGHAHAVRVEVGPEVGVGLVLELDEARGVLVVLDDPAAPEVRDALLVAGRADDGDGVQVDGLFDGVGGLGGLAVDEDRVALEQDLFEEVVHVLLCFDDALGHHLGGDGADIVQVGVPQLGRGLLLEPLLHDQQTEDDAGRLVLAARGRLVRRGQDRLRDDGAVRLGDLLFLELVRDDLLDLVLQAQADLGHLFGVDRRRVHMLAARGEDWRGSVSGHAEVRCGRLTRIGAVLEADAAFALAGAEELVPRRHGRVQRELRGCNGRWRARSTPITLVRDCEGHATRAERLGAELIALCRCWQAGQLSGSPLSLAELSIENVVIVGARACFNFTHSTRTCDSVNSGPTSHTPGYHVI